MMCPRDLSTINPRRRGGAVLPMVAGLAVLGACGGDQARGSGGGPLGPVYAMMVQVLSPDGEDRTVYAVLTDTLDVDVVSLAGARELSGVANFAAVGGHLFVSSGDEPRITRYAITGDRKWEEGASISFANYPLLPDGANIFYQYFLDDQTAYLPFNTSSRIIWNPSSMTITDMREDSKLSLTRDLLNLEIGGNRTGIAYTGPVMQPFFYHDAEWFKFAPTSPIAVYQPGTHIEKAVIEAPCPGLAIATRDEAGNTYFSSWDYSPGQALYHLAPAPCVVRVRPDLTLDQAWTTDLTSWTAGRFALNFRYLGGSKALAQVLHHEEINLDFSAPYDSDVEDAIWQGGHFRLWFFDLEQGSGQPIEGIEPGSSGFQLVQVDGRTFIFATYDSAARTVAYELGPTGQLTERFRTTGEVFKCLRVR